MNVILLFYLIISILSLFVHLYRRYFIKKVKLTEKSVLITGASSGLGIALAQESLELGADTVILCSRNTKSLEKVRNELVYDLTKQNVYCIQVDVTNHASVAGLVEKLRKLGVKRIDYLFSNAGYARPGTFEEIPLEEFNNLINVNYLGSVYVTRTLKKMMPEGSHIIFSGSVCSLISFNGYSAYGPSKYALKGFADSIRNEFLRDGINVHIGILSSMSTPGYEIENRTKPAACEAIEGTATLFSVEQVSDIMFQAISRNDFLIITEPLSFFIKNVSFGIAPTSNIFLDILIAPFIPIIRFLAKIYIDYRSKNTLEKSKRD